MQDVTVPFLREVRSKEDHSTLNEYPFSIPAFKKQNIHIQFNTPVTFFVGENGSGKSTLLEALAIKSGFNPAGGTRHSLNVQRASESILSEHLRCVWRKKLYDGFFLRAESFFNFASFLEEWEKETGRDFHAPYGGKSLHEQSHGESFLSLFKNRFSSGLFYLDEPEAALSPQRQLAFLSLLHNLVQTGKAQFIIATHSPILLSYPGATIFSFDSQGLTEIAYKDTEHYRVTKDFLENPDIFLNHLFSSE